MITFCIVIGMIASIISAGCNNLLPRLIFAFIAAVAFVTIQIRYENLKERVVMLEMERLLYELKKEREK